MSRLQPLSVAALAIAFATTPVAGAQGPGDRGSRPPSATLVSAGSQPETYSPAAVPHSPRRPGADSVRRAPLELHASPSHLGGRDRSSRRDTFAYRLETPARVRSVVLDLQGREIAVIEDADRDAGYHALVWNGRLADGQVARPGIYFVRARIEGSRDRVWRVVRLQ